MKFSYVLAVTSCATFLAGCAQWNEQFNGAEAINFNQMTLAAQATVRDEIGNQPIAAITKEIKYGDPSYRVEVEQPGLNPTLWVAANGSILKESRRLVCSNSNHYQIKQAAGAQAPHTQKSIPSSTTNY